MFTAGANVHPEQGLLTQVSVPTQSSRNIYVPDRAHSSHLKGEEAVTPQEKVDPG